MSYFNGLINTWFKKIENNKVLFYPYGKFGHGYIVDSDTEISIKSFLRRYYAFAFLTIIIFSVLFKSFLSFLLLFIFVPVYFFRIKQLLFVSKESKETIKYKEAMNNMAISMGTPTAFIILFGSLLLSAAGIFNVFFLGHKTLMDISGVIFFGFCFLLSILLVRRSSK